MTPDLHPRMTQEADVQPSPDTGWRLRIPAGSAARYRLAQLDDYLDAPRSAFRWQAPLRLQVRARVSDADIPGTWGFGFWNDPFSMGMGIEEGATRRLPALPETAWFFYASSSNYLALRDTHPAQGLLMGTFASINIPPLLLVLGLPALPWLLWPPSAGLLRRLARPFIHESATRLDIDPTVWHDYALVWRPDIVCFFLDGRVCFETDVVPNARLGLVLWIDNQYAAFRPGDRLRFGTLPATKSVALMVSDVTMEDL